MAATLPYCGYRGPQGRRTRRTAMKVDLYDAPLSDEAEKLLQDPRAAQDLLISIMECGDDCRHFEVRSGTKTLDVWTSSAILAGSEA